MFSPKRGESLLETQNRIPPDWYKYRTILILYVIVYQTALFPSRWMKIYFKFTKSFTNSFRFRQQFTFVVETIFLLLFLWFFFVLSLEKNNKGISD